MSEQWAKLDGGRFLAHEFSQDSIRATFYQKIIDAINYTGSLVGVNPAGNVQPPPPVDHINVKVSGEMAHVTLTQNGSIRKGAHYFLEVANEPNFTQPIVKHLGVSRSGEPFTLPTMDDNGNMQSWYFRAYCQYPGSKPSAINTYGGNRNPQAVQMSGTTKFSLLPSTGSGTASSTGQQGGSGFGKFNVKPVISGPQRASVNAIVPVKG